MKRLIHETLGLKLDPKFLIEEENGLDGLQRVSAEIKEIVV